MLSCALTSFGRYYEIIYLPCNVEAPFPISICERVRGGNGEYRITEFGADTAKINTEAIAKAIEACHNASADGRQRVIIPAGKWKTGPIHLKSNVELHFEDGAILEFTDNPKDYLPAVKTSWEGMECYNYSPLIYAYDCEDIAITGNGMLCPKMETWERWFGRPEPHMKALAKLYTMASTDVPVEQRQMAVGQNHLRPHLIHFNRCKDVLLDGFKIRESPFWTIHMYMCDNGIVRNLDVKAHGHNNDGIDIEMSRNFLIEKCTFDQGDDAVVIKAGRNRDAWRLNTPTENIVIRNCTILEGHTLLGIGSEISGGIRNVYMHDCAAPQSVRRLFFVKTNHRRGGFIENITMENIKTGEVQRVLEIDTDVLYQWKDLVPTYETKITSIDGINIRNIQCQMADAVYDLKGDKRNPIGKVTLENIRVGKVNDFFKNVNNVDSVVEQNVTTGQWSEAVVHNGIPWFDKQGNIINAHGACIVEDGGRYWLFGEYKSDESNAFPGFGCYSSIDLVNWRFERVVLPVQKDGILGPNRVGERVKVMKCPKTGEYVMFMHADDLNYSDPHIGIAVCDKINGDYKLLGAIEYNGQPIRRWDMGTFQDEDGTGYLLTHHGPIYKLSDDYRSVVDQVANVQGLGESPAMFKKNGTYFLLTSNLTNWERNDNYYLTAKSIRGPWKKRGYFCPEGTYTYNSQSTFVFPLQKEGQTIPMYMGDRWSYPHQASAATYVWMPIKVEGDSISIPEYWPEWDIEKIVSYQNCALGVVHNWRSDKKEDILKIPFKGKKISLYGKTDSDGGYATVRIKDKKGNVLHSSYVDFYSRAKNEAIRFISPVYPEDEYVLEVEVSGKLSECFEKSGLRYGSSGYYVDVTKSIAE